MIAAIVIVSLLLVVLFVAVAVAGNRAHTRMIDENRTLRESRGDPPLEPGDRVG